MLLSLCIPHEGRQLVNRETHSVGLIGGMITQ